MNLGNSMSSVGYDEQSKAYPRRSWTTFFHRIRTFQDSRMWFCLKSTPSLRVCESVLERMKDRINLMQDYTVYCLKNGQQIKVTPLTALSLSRDSKHIDGLPSICNTLLKMIIAQAPLYSKTRQCNTIK